MTPQDFIELLQPAALACSKSGGIPFAFTVAQGALESGWGKSLLFREAKNMFGVKADRSWKGERYELLTREFRLGEWISVNAQWRKYATFDECMADHAKFFKENPRYARALEYPDNGIQFATEVARAGYATDPTYAQKLIAIMNAHSLCRYEIWA